jgi:hypothetical protein
MSERILCICSTNNRYHRNYGFILVSLIIRQFKIGASWFIFNDLYRDRILIVGFRILCMSHFMNQEERQRHGEQFLCTLYAMTDGNVGREIGAEEVYAGISYNLGGFGKKDEKTDKGQTVQQAIIDDLIYHLTQERLNSNRRPEPQIDIRLALHGM